MRPMVLEATGNGGGGNADAFKKVSIHIGATTISLDDDRFCCSICNRNDWRL